MKGTHLYLSQLIMLSVQKSQELERAALKDQETQLDKELQETEDQIVSMKATIEQQKSALRGALSKEAEKK